MAADMNLDEHVRRIIAIHFDPAGGAPYWLERQRALGINAVRDIRTAGDLDKLGPMNEIDLRDRPVLDFVPLSRRADLVGAIVTETGGHTGLPKRTIYTPDEFRQAFVEPFVRVATHAHFPRGLAWLYVGPSGPHVIGQAAAACAAALESPQPFSVDFDPRWFRKMPADSMAQSRYLDHLLNQAMHTLAHEPIGVLFTTPVILERLAAVMTAGQRGAIRGVHYGGMRIAPVLLRAAQTQWFPDAVHLAGYGNSLFGLCMEFGGEPERPLRYFPHGPRQLVRVHNDSRVWMSRLDSTVLIANLPERDRGSPASPPVDGPSGFGAGVEDPRPMADRPVTGGVGIY